MRCSFLSSCLFLFYPISHGFSVLLPSDTKKNEGVAHILFFIINRRSRSIC